MIKKLLLIALIFLIVGCTAKPKEVVVLTKYVCADGWVVASSDRCPKSEIRAQPNLSEEKPKTLPLKSPYMSAKELDQVAEDVLNKINEERGKLNLEPYQQSMELQSAAQDFSVKYLQQGYISSEDLNKRLEASTIFYFESAENLAIMPFTDNANIGADAVQKWMVTPEQKQLLLDEKKHFTHIGTGVSCSLENCYVVLDLIAAKRLKPFIIEPGSHAFESIYNDSIPYNFSINFTLYLNSKQNFDFYIVSNESSYERFKQNMGYDPVTLEKDIKNTTFSITAEKGYGIILIPQEKYSDTVIFYEQEFNGFAK